MNRRRTREEGSRALNVCNDKLYKYVGSHYVNSRICVVVDGSLVSCSTSDFFASRRPHGAVFRHHARERASRTSASRHANAYRVTHAVPVCANRSRGAARRLASHASTSLNAKSSGNALTFSPCPSSMRQRRRRRIACATGSSSRPKTTPKSSARAPDCVSTSFSKPWSRTRPSPPSR